MRWSPRVILVRVIKAIFIAWALLILAVAITPAVNRQMFQNVSGFHDRRLFRDWAPQRPFRGSDESEMWLDKELNLCVIITGAKSKSEKDAEGVTLHGHEFGPSSSRFFVGSKDEVRVEITDTNMVVIIGSMHTVRVPIVDAGFVVRCLDEISAASADTDLAAFLGAVKMEDPEVLNAIAESDRE